MSPEKKDRRGVSKVVHISKARLRFDEIRPKTEPPYPVDAIWPKEVPGRTRADIADAEIRVDMELGDPVNFALRKVRYVLERAAEAFREEEALEHAVIHMVNIIRDFGEPEGIVLLRLARGLYGDRQRVREAISEAVAMSGSGEHLEDILSMLRQDIRDPSRHLGSISQFVQRHPDTVDTAIQALEPYASFDWRYSEAVNVLRTLPEE